jgi:hypothetical protein
MTRIWRLPHPYPAYPDLSDGNLWCRRKTNATTPLFNSYVTGVPP